MFKTMKGFIVAYSTFDNEFGTSSFVTDSIVFKSFESAQKRKTEIHNNLKKDFFKRIDYIGINEVNIEE